MNVTIDARGGLRRRHDPLVRTPGFTEIPPAGRPLRASRWARAAVYLIVAAACSSEPVTDPSPLPAWPDTIAAIGDSITTAAVPDLDHLSADNPGLSWATGSAAVGSHRARIEERHPDVTAHNVAVAGARVADARAQADRVVAADADYVLFLLGSNDLCATDPPAHVSFEREVGAALESLHDGLPEAYVFVASLPDVVRLRELFAGDVRARTAWQRTGACPAVLGSGRSDSELAAVRDRHAAYNRALADACDRHARCRHDAGRVAQHRFSRDEVSRADFFHPSVDGQRRLAELTWRAAFRGGS